MATRTTQLGASAKRRTTTSGGRSSSRARSSAKSRDRKAPIRSLLAPLAIVAVIVIAAWSFYPVARLQYSEEREQARLEAELDGLKERNAELRTQVDRLKTPEGVEEVARESLGMVKEGENLVVIVDGTESQAAAVVEPDTPVIPEPEPSWWQRVLDTVFGIE